MTDEYNTTPEETQEKVSKKVLKKGQKEVEKRNKVLQQLKIQYVTLDKLKPNEYNPNRQSEHDFELLLRSMREDGFTQPIVAQMDGTIVDGEHRWRAAQVLNMETIPVVYVEMTAEQMRIATLRHNRARGSEDVELSAQVLRDLQELGALDWAQDSLMLDDEEMQRLMDDIAAPEALAGEEYSEAWAPDTIKGDEREANDTEGREIENSGGGKIFTGMSQTALMDKRKREEAIKQAKTLEEKEQIRRDQKFYRVSLLFSDGEAELVKSILGNKPAEKLLEMCKKETVPSS